jgi:RNA polymerase sigma factor (sigma-70 family)
MVLRVAGPHQERRDGFETLCRRYWKPIYCFLRRALRRDNESAKDLTQDFFLWLDQGEVLARFDPQAGAFSAFLKGLLRNFVRNHDGARRSLKRGGGRALVTLDGAERIEDTSAPSPEEAFDHAWVDALIEDATERVRQTLREEGQTVRLQVFELYELAEPNQQPTYVDLAARLGIKKHDVRNHLFATREKVRSEIRRALADTVTSLTDLEQEWRRLFEQA